MVGSYVVRRWARHAIETIWPAACVACGRDGSWWCDHCDAKVVTIGAPGCPRCQRLNTDGRYCPRCRPTVDLTGLMIGAHYRDPLPTAIKALKYRHAKQVAIPLARHLLPPLARLRDLPRSVLLPIPLHPIRLAQRGHNQAELLAELVATATGIPINHQLVRSRHTPSQTGLDRRQRIANVAGAFAWRGPPLEASIAIIVDDIATTGATLNAAAEALRAAGARQVWGLAVARR